MGRVLTPIQTPVVSGAGDSGLMKVLHGAQTPLYITAGLIDEWRKRDKGLRPTPYSTILKESANNLLPFFGENKRRTTYGDMVDNRVLALGLDILGDPITYIPAAAMVKLWKVPALIGSAAIKIPIKGAAKIADKTLGIPATQGLETLADSVRRAFIPKYDLNRLGGKELNRMIEKHYRDIDSAAKEARERVQGSIDKLIPDMQDQMKVFDLVERRPIKSTGLVMDPAELKALTTNEEFIAWGREIAALSPALKKGYAEVVMAANKLEKIKIEAGFLTQAHAEGFIKKTGVQHLLHMRGRKEDVIERGEDLLKSYERGDARAIQIIKTWGKGPGKGVVDDPQAAIDDIRRTVESARNAPDILGPSGMERLRQSMAFTHARKELGTAKNIVDNNLQNLNMRVGEVMGIEAGMVAKGAASMRHVEALSDFIKSKSMIFDDIPTEKELIAKFGKSRAKNISRGGFVKMSDMGVPALEGKYIPKPISDEMKRVMSAYRNPQFIRGFLEKYRNVQNVWKAWTLAIFPTYHIRNHISNLWNNFLAGMGPESANHYAHAAGLLTKKQLGTLSKAEKVIIDEATDMRVLKQGFFRGEFGDVFEQMNPIGKAVTNIWHPKHNKAIKAGFWVGNQVEDSSRLAHYMWAKGKGLSPEDAASSVNKFLFDYKYGLTAFEKKAFRDFSAPFYAWTRFNLPLQLEALALRPGRFLMLPKGMRALEDVGGALKDEWGGPKPNEIFMADWMKRATKIRVRWNPKGNAYEYAILDNWIPSADLNKLFDIQAFRDLVVGLMSPGIKLPIEILFNYNLFRKRKIKVYAGQRGKLFDKSIEPRLEHVARTIRLINEADKIYQAFVLQHGEVSKLEAVSRVFATKLYPYRPDRQKSWWVWETNKRVGELGGMRRFAEKRGWKDQVGVLDGLIEEIKAERDYYKKLKVGR